MTVNYGAGYFDPNECRCLVCVPLANESSQSLSAVSNDQHDEHDEHEAVRSPGPIDALFGNFY